MSSDAFRTALQNEGVSPASLSAYGFDSMVSIALGFGGFAQEGLTLTQKEWDEFMLLADPTKEGKIRYRNFIGRCRLRHDSFQSEYFVLSYLSILSCRTSVCPE